MIPRCLKGTEAISKLKKIKLPKISKKKKYVP